MVIGYHLVWTAYGTWLGNDPRGSMSEQVTSRLLADLGPVHYGRKKIQPSRRQVDEFYQEANKLLAYPVLRFTPVKLNRVLIPSSK
jgi:hypothetical protein